MIGLEKVAEVKVKLEDQLQAYQYWNQNFVAVSDKNKTLFSYTSTVRDQCTSHLLRWLFFRKWYSFLKLQISKKQDRRYSGPTAHNG